MTEGLRKRNMKLVEASEGDLNVFEWNITNFKDVFEETGGGEHITSPVFVGKCNEQPNSFWKIEVHPKETDDDGEEGYLDVFLVLIKELNEHTPVIKTRCAFFLLDRNQHEVSTDYEDEFGVEDYRLGFKMATHSQLFDDKNKFLEDDMLRVRVKVWIQNVEMNAPESKIQKKLQLKNDLRQLFDSSEFSDVTIEVEDLTLKAHKNILSCRSPVFSAMFQNKMSESLTSTVKIEDFSSKTVKGMLEFIYFENIEIVDEDFVELLKIAEKYQLIGLKAACTKTAILKMSTENIIDLLILGDMYNTPELKSKAMVFINSNKANPMFSQGNGSAAFEKFAEEHPKLFVEMYQSIRDKHIGRITTFTTTDVSRIIY